MPVITLPDGSQRSYSEPVSIEKVAADIGPGLAKAALAGKVSSTGRSGGRDRDRTCDPYHVKVVLYR